MKDALHPRFVVKKFERLDEATAPDGTVLTLYRHDRDYYIRVNGIELMSSRRHHSEERLATLVCEPLRDARAPRVLVGGLGLGFTLRAALSVLPPDAEVVVVELLQAVIGWNENAELGLAWREMRDPRVRVLHADVADVLDGASCSFDGIMLDVDNGADAFTSSQNARLYRDEGIRAAAAALRPGGRLAYWSDVPDPSFVAALREAELEVEAERARAHTTTGPRHAIYVARRRGGAHA